MLDRILETQSRTTSVVTTCRVSSAALGARAMSVSQIPKSANTEPSSVAILHLQDGFRSFYISAPPEAPCSYLWVCPRCCDIWATLRIEGKYHYFQYSIPCQLCRPWSHQLVPGSLLWHHPGAEDEFDDWLLPVLPPELLLRELDLHIKAISIYGDSPSECTATPTQFDAYLTRILAPRGG